MAFLKSTDHLVEGLSNLFFTNDRAIAAVQSQLDSLNSAITTEVSRAEGAEASITSALNAEISRAQAAEAAAIVSANSYTDTKVADLIGAAPSLLQTLQAIDAAINNDPNFSTSITNLINNNLVTAKAYTDTQVGAEQTRAEGIEAGLRSDLSAEVGRAQGVESGLDARISVLETDPTTKTYVDTQVAAEASRAQGVESSLNSAILAEVSRAEGIEGGLRSDLNSEISRAQAAEAGIASDLSNEVSRAQAAEGVLTTNLASEVSRAQSAEAGIASDLSAEVTRAEGIEAGLRSDLNSEISRAQAAEAGIASDLSAEVSRAQGQEALMYLLDGSRQISGNVLFSSDAVNDIGAKNGNRAAHIFAAKNIYTNVPSSLVDALNGLGYSQGCIVSGDGATGLNIMYSGRGESGLLMADAATLNSYNVNYVASGGFFQIYKNNNASWGRMAQFGRKSDMSDFDITFGDTLNGAIARDVNVLFKRDGFGSIGKDSDGGYARPGGVYVGSVINLGSLSASTVLVSDASNNLVSSVVTSTELSFLSGVTSSIQTQINNEASARAAADSAEQTRAQAAEALLLPLDGSKPMSGSLLAYGGMAVAQKAVSNNYSVAVSDCMVGVSDLTMSRTITLPAPSSVQPGQVFVIKDLTGLATESVYVNIVTAAGQIDGNSNYQLKAGYESVQVMCDGTNYWLM